MKTFQLKKTKTNLNLSIYSIFKTAFTNYINLIPITRWSFDNVMISMRSSEVDVDSERAQGHHKRSRLSHVKSCKCIILVDDRQLVSFWGIRTALCFLNEV